MYECSKRVYLLALVVELMYENMYMCVCVCVCVCLCVYASMYKYTRTNWSIMFSYFVCARLIYRYLWRHFNILASNDLKTQGRAWKRARVHGSSKPRKLQRISLWFGGSEINSPIVSESDVLVTGVHTRVQLFRFTRGFLTTQSHNACGKCIW